ncbi:hypothetical protein QFZ73_005652 [Peribacillus sp. V2I11]|nr:hypothetical protein [Peribacillus sp. V2I11]
MGPRDNERLPYNGESLFFELFFLNVHKVIEDAKRITELKGTTNTAFEVNEVEIVISRRYK